MFYEAIPHGALPISLYSELVFLQMFCFSEGYAVSHGYSLAKAEGVIGKLKCMNNLIAVILIKVIIILLNVNNP